MVVLVVVKGENAETPSVVLALMSYPASFVAQFFASLPVKVEGLPDPSLILVPLATTALGFAQWFALVPWIADKVMAWHRDTPVTRTDVSRGNVASVIILLVTWSIAEIAAIALSISLNPVTHKVVRHLGAVVFHLWLAIPMALAAAAAAVAIARLFYSRDTTFWIISLASLFLCGSAINAATLLFGFGSSKDHVGRDQAAGNARDWRYGGDGDDLERKMKKTLAVIAENWR